MEVKHCHLHQQQHCPVSMLSRLGLLANEGAGPEQVRPCGNYLHWDLAQLAELSPAVQDRTLED